MFMNGIANSPLDPPKSQIMEAQVSADVDILVPTYVMNPVPWKWEDPFAYRVSSLCGYELLSDAEIIAGQHKMLVPVHRLVLEAASSVFCTLFKETPIKNSLFIMDVDFGSFQVLLRHIYGDINAPIHSVVELLEQAHRFRIPQTVEKCVEKLQYEKVEGADCLRLLEVGLALDNPFLIDTAVDSICRNAWVLIELNEFLISPAHVVEVILQQDRLVLMDEMQLFKSLMRWGSTRVLMDLHNLTTFEGCVRPLLRHIRFPVMSVMDFIEHIVPTGLLSNQDCSTVLLTLQRIKCHKALNPFGPCNIEMLNASQFSCRLRHYYAPDCPLELDTESLGISSSICTFGVPKTPDATLEPPAVPSVTSFNVLDHDSLVSKFYFRVEGISELAVGTHVYSPPMVIGTAPWQIVMDKQMGVDLTEADNPNFDGQPRPYLSVHLNCLQAVQTQMEWAFPVDGVFKLRNQQATGITKSKNYYKHLRHIYRPTSTVSGFSKFISWKELTNPANGFVAHNAILFEADVGVGAANIKP